MSYTYIFLTFIKLISGSLFLLNSYGFPLHGTYLVPCFGQEPPGLFRWVTLIQSSVQDKKWKLEFWNLDRSLQEMIFNIITACFKSSWRWGVGDPPKLNHSINLIWLNNEAVLENQLKDKYMSVQGWTRVYKDVQGCTIWPLAHPRSSNGSGVTA